MNIPVLFILFLSVVFVFYWRLSKLWQNLLLSSVSLLFYAWVDWRFPILLLILTVVNYICGNKIAFAQSDVSRKTWLFIALIASIGLLGYFKYANFFINSYIALANSVGWHVTNFEIQILVPVGISFFTFQALTYPLDLYFGRSKNTASFLIFITYVTFLPKLFAGPIARANNFMSGLSEKRTFQIENIEDGCIRFLTGYFKKVIVADNIAIYLVNPVMISPNSYSSTTLWVAMLGYAVQIYADFSGYSNMAIGSAKILGLKIPENFAFPYLATSFSDFWRRWHITMSTFFRDYIYIPMGGSHKNALRTLLNLEFTMLICGLWHGPSWTFVFWGALHGLYLAIDRYLSKMTNLIQWGSMGAGGRRFAVVTRWSYTQSLICLAWIPFAASTFDTAILYLKAMFINESSEILFLTPPVLLGFGAFIVDHTYGWIVTKWPGVERQYIHARAMAYACMIILLYHFVPDKPNPFIYFQF